MYRWFLIILFLNVQIGLSQEESGTAEPFSITPSFNLGCHANLDDFYVDLGGGVEEKKTRVGLNLNFAFRPFYKKVQVFESTNVIRQWKEKKYFISLDVYKRLLDFSLGAGQGGFQIGAKTGYLFGDYLGTRQRPKAGVTLNPFVGAHWFIDGLYLQLSYLQFNDRLASVPNGRIMFTICVLLE